MWTNVPSASSAWAQSHHVKIKQFLASLQSPSQMGSLPVTARVGGIFKQKCNKQRKQQALDLLLTSFHTYSWGLDWCFSFEKTRRLKRAKKWHFEQNMFREYMWIWRLLICCVKDKCKFKLILLFSFLRVIHSMMQQQRIGAWWWEWRKI